MLPKVDSQSPSMLKKKKRKTNFLCLTGILIWIKAIRVTNSVLIRNTGTLKKNEVGSSINVIFFFNGTYEILLLISVTLHYKEEKAKY